MKKTLFLATVAGICLYLNPCSALTLSSAVLKDSTTQMTFPVQFAYCKANGHGGVEQSNDISPPLSWSNVPAGTRSFVLIFSDPSAPNSPNFNVPGKTIALDVPRGGFYHWVLINIPAKTNALPKGAGSTGFVAGGKQPGLTAYGLAGLNSYTDVFSSPLSSRVSFTKTSLKGEYGQYDGPCSPFNDLALHQYTFTLYAVDVPTLPLPTTGHFTADQVIAALNGHILAETQLVSPYTTNKTLLSK